MMMSCVGFRVTFVLRFLIGLFGKRTCVASNQITFPVSRYLSMNLSRAYLRAELNVYRLWVREDGSDRTLPGKDDRRQERNRVREHYPTGDNSNRLINKTLQVVSHAVPFRQCVYYMGV
jgi:hypothetical protein